MRKYQVGARAEFRLLSLESEKIHPSFRKIILPK